MAPNSEADPKESPGSSPRQEPRLPIPSDVLLTLSLIVWLLLLGSYLLNPLHLFFTFIDFTPRPEPEMTPEEKSAIFTKAGFAIGGAILFYWLFFRLLIHPRRISPGTWPATLVGLIGILVIYPLIKLFDLFGLALAVPYDGRPVYPAYLLPGLIAIILCNPWWMLGQRVLQWQPAD